MRPAAVGTVKTVGTDTFTLATADGTVVTVNVSSSTTYDDPNVSSASFSNVTVGAHVAVFGTDASNTVTATKVMIGGPPFVKMGPGGMGGSPPAAFGTVKSVGSNTFTLTTFDGTTVTVDVSSSTKYVDPGVSSPSFANVTVGGHVAVFGTDTSNTVTATTVAIGPDLKSGGAFRMGPGGATSYSASSGSSVN
jgi:preprotein translocase subunit YajC